MKKIDLAFLVTGSVMTIIFLFIVNMLTSVEHIWFMYPAVVMLVFPLGLYCYKQKKQTLFAIITSTLLLILLIIENRSTPTYPWVSYTVIPLVYWPILVFLGAKAKTLRVAVVGSGVAILYYFLLNVIVSPHTPWVIFPAFAVLWWPLSVYHVRRSTYFTFSLHASLLLCLFFIMVNIIYSPGTIWAIYPIFAILWWPLSLYFFVYKRNTES
ncbi:MAG: hypothetical protein ACQEWU_06820 [Bacillota bacterium]|nr:MULTISPECIES: hypothetical protein [Bacillaceae]MCC2251351.1 hypothetical protein [Virgibacillus sp. AGTR]